jgi:hypothetical protein
MLFRAPAPELARTFLEAIRGVLANRVVFIQKNPGEKSKRYKMTEWEAGPNGYQILSTTFSRHPVGNGIWIKTNSSLSAAGDGPDFPRLFQRTDGQLVFAIQNEESALSLLLTLQPLISEASSFTVAERLIESPNVNLGFSMQIDVMERVLAKIGVNFAIHELGGEFVAHHAFDSVKKAILTGSPRIAMVMANHDDGLHEIFSGVPHDRHVLILATLNVSPGLCHLVVIVRLYGSTIFQIVIAENIPRPKKPLPVFYVVEYNKHKIESFDSLGYMQTFRPPHWRNSSVDVSSLYEA